MKKIENAPSVPLHSFLLTLALTTNLIQKKQIMLSSERCIFLITIIALSCTAADGALAWGAFLGADWRIGEGERKSIAARNSQHILSRSIKQSICKVG